MIRSRALTITLAAGLAATVPGSALAQVLGNVGQTVGQVGGPVGGAVGGLGGTMDRIGNSVGQLSDPAQSVFGVERTARNSLNYVGAGLLGGGSAGSLLDARTARMLALVRDHKRELEMGPGHNPVRRGQLLLIDATAAQRGALKAAGFREVSQDSNGLVSIVRLAVPGKMPIAKAKATAEAAAPGVAVDFDAIYEPAGGGLRPAAGLAMAAGASLRAGTRVAMIDGGVASHPSLKRASIEQRGFAGRAAATGHGTAVASLLVGDQGPFRGAARGASLFVADIYGGNPAAGSASSIVSALAWAASKAPSVITISLVGPMNRPLASAIAAVQRRGIPVVAAVGNDGPAAPAAYPASLPGVIAITGVDGRGSALLEAGRANHLDFAAPGADLIAANPGSDYVTVRGTSFAAPLAAARLAATGSLQALTGEARPGKGRIGRGIVCATCATPPSAARLKK